MTDSSNIQFTKRKEWAVQDIRIGYAELDFDGIHCFQSANEADVVRFHFGLIGDYRFDYRELGQSFDLIGGHHNIMYSNPFHIEVENKTSHLSIFGIQFPRVTFQQLIPEEDTFFRTFLTDLSKGDACILSPVWGSIHSNIQQVIDQIIDHPFHGALENIFLYSKSLELLVLCTANYQQMIHSQNGLKKKEDREKIIAARDFINERLHNPPTLSEIAQYVGLNEYKLKKGFRSMYQQSVFNYLTDRRLNLGYQHLIDTEESASQIAYHLGYSSVQHFSTAIKNKFGKSPRQLRQEATP